MQKLVFLTTVFGITLMSSVSSSLSASITYEAPKIYDLQISSDETILICSRHGQTLANVLNKLSGGGLDDAAGMTALNEQGRKQAIELGDKIVKSGIVFERLISSPRIRALDTAAGVVEAFKKNGKYIEVSTSGQLTEILHGKYELTDGKIREQQYIAKFNNMLAQDEMGITSEDELNDKFRFMKIHPQAEQDEIVPEEIVNADDFLSRGETRPETPYKFWLRISNEFFRIAQENPGATVGISTHGAVLGTLLDVLNTKPKGQYISPHYNAKEFTIGDKVKIPAATKIENCALLIFKCNFKTRTLEFIPEEQWTELFSAKSEKPVSVPSYSVEMLKPPMKRTFAAKFQNSAKL